MLHQNHAASDLPHNYLQLHENAFVSPLNLINVVRPAPISFGRAPHLLQQTIPAFDMASSTSSMPHLQSIDADKLHMYTFLAQRKLKEDRWKKQMVENNPVKQTFQRRNLRATPQPPMKKPSPRSASAPKKPISSKKDSSLSHTSNATNRSEMTPAPIAFTSAPSSRSVDSTNTAHYISKQKEIADVHNQLIVQLRTLHDPPARENVIDETEQEKQRRIRLKRERIRRDLRAIYNAHQELKQILADVHQPDANLHRLIHRHLNAYKAVLLAVETLANEAPLKSQDAPVQQLFAAVAPILDTLTNANRVFGLSQLHIDPSFLQIPPSKSAKQRIISDARASPSNHLLLPSVYQELMKKKQQHRKARPVPSVLRPRSADSVRLPRADMSHQQQPAFARPTLAMQSKTRARSHSPLPSVRSASTIATQPHSRFTVDQILVKLAPRLLATYTGRELSEQIERARTLIPMFLVDDRLTDDEIVGRVAQMIIPRQQQQLRSPPQTSYEILETPDEHARRVNLDVYQTQISTWEDEMARIRQRVQTYRTHEYETASSNRRTVTFQVDQIEPSPLPENLHIHTPLFEHTLEDFVTKPSENRQAFETLPSSSHGIRLRGLDSSKIRQIEQYRRDYQAHLHRTESARTEDFDPCQVINRLSEFLLDEALLSVVNEVELLTVELSQKLVENELLGREVSLADVEKDRVHQQQQQYRRPIQQIERKHSPASLSSPVEQYNMSSFEDDFNSESKLSRSDDDDIPRQKPPMESTGRFTTVFERRRSHSPSSSSSSGSHAPQGIILKPSVVVKKPSTIDDESERDADSSPSLISSRQKVSQRSRQQQQRRRSSDDDPLLSMKTGEKIYSTDFEESKSNRRRDDDDDDDDEEEGADTMKLSARSLHTFERGSFDSDED